MYFYLKKNFVSQFFRIENFLYIIPITLISIYYSIYRFKAQSAVDGGLIISDIVNYPEKFSNVVGAIHDSYTFLHQVINF